MQFQRLVFAKSMAHHNLSHFLSQTQNSLNDSVLLNSTPLETGTYGAKALKEIPKPRRGRGRRGRSRGGSTAHTPGGMYDRRGQQPQTIPEEGGQHSGMASPSQMSAQGMQGAGKPRYGWPGTSYAQSQQRPQYSAPASRSGYQAPVDPHLDPRRYAAQNVAAEKMYPVAGATGGKRGESVS